MILLRSVREKDFADLYELASILDSLNLPHDKRLLRHNIRYAVQSFRGRQKEKAKAIYTFVAEDTRTKRVVGTSSIFARHGAERAPHSYLDVRREVRRSRTLGIRVAHRTLQMGWNKDGPTEVGGLVVKPGYRGLPVKVGKQLSLIRFLYMALHPGRFKKRVLCEFLPDFSRTGKSLLWEHLGRKLTGLEYHRADLLSATNKEFILGLFPRAKIYATLFPQSVQDILEKTGKDSLPAQKMLERIGFRYLKQICPFDGGPHFGAQLEDISVVRRSKFLRVKAMLREFPAKEASQGLILSEKRGELRAMQSDFIARRDEIFLPAQTQEILQVKSHDPVIACAIG